MFEYTDDGNSGFGANGFQMMGMINALKTGNVQVDMVIAMCVPFILKMLFQWVGKLEDLLDWKVWAKWLEAKTPKYERFISNSTFCDSWGSVYNMDDDIQNSVLLKAIKLYLDQVLKLKLDTAHLDLTGIEDNNTCYDCDDYDSGYDDGEDDGEGYGSRRTIVGTLSQYKIIKRLPNNEWRELGEFGSPPFPIELRIEEQSNKEGTPDDNKEKPPMMKHTTFHLSSPGEQTIDCFINIVYKWYMDELRKRETNARHLYEMKAPGLKIGANNDGNGSTTYKRYKLSDSKTFDSLFFREKESLLSLVDNFNAKTGKYAIKGYPHKLGILLHGPPGTGKTSVIKALAEYFGRSIVNVPLSRISTNSELMSVFFDRKYNIEGSYVPVKMGFKDIIYVMEDVDAASNVVKRRDGKKMAEIAQPKNIKLPVPKSLWRMLLESRDNDCKELVKELMEKSERLKTEAKIIGPDVVKAIAQRLTSSPELGLLGEAHEDRSVAQVVEKAMEAAKEQREKYIKLDELLSTHAKAIKDLLRAGTEVDEEFVDELLGESDSLTASLASTSFSSDTSSSPIDDEIPNDRYHASQFQNNNPNRFEDKQSDGLVGEKKTSTKKKDGFLGPLLKPNPDQLSLSGLLNVLDGVVDTPGRIVIMTTNHPEMLDPALIRPGRVDKKLLLGYMEAPDVAQMLEHYFQTTLDEERVTWLQDLINGDDDDRRQSRLNLTPAQVEQLSAEHEKLDDMLQALEEMAKTTLQSRNGRNVI